MIKVPLAIMTTPKTEWCLPGLIYLLDTRIGHPASQSFDIHIFGYDQTDQELFGRPDLTFHSIGDFADYPAGKWTDSFIVVLDKLRQMGVENFVFMLEDYWPVRGIDYNAIHTLWTYAEQCDDILKIDLASDRLYSDPQRWIMNYNTAFSLGYLDVIQARPGDQYYVSLWCGIFNVINLRKLVNPGWTAQELELRGTELVHRVYENTGTPPPRHLGTRQAPLQHDNIVHNGEAFKFPSPLKVEDHMIKAMNQLGLTNGYNGE